MARARSPQPIACARGPARGRLDLSAERQGSGGPSGLQNRQGGAAPRLEGSIPSPLRTGEGASVQELQDRRLDQARVVYLRQRPLETGLLRRQPSREPSREG